MTNRRKLVVGNWKMNGLLGSGTALAKALADEANAAKPLAFDMAICPPATLLAPIAEILDGSPIGLGAQDCHTQNHGAYTGEIGAGMLKDAGCRYVILGHSERRAMRCEGNALVAEKVAAAQTAGLTAILCVGETQRQRADGETCSVITLQLTESLPKNLAPDLLVVAYEPIWAIGTGVVPSLDDIREVHRLIRETLGVYGDAVRILYGGSVTPGNAATLLADSEIDGALVGGASLNADGFWAIGKKCGYTTST